jgi:hypothetical protein
MAKADTVYSMFGLKTPQQVAAEERNRAMKYLAGQRTGYQQAGAGIGLLLSSLFGDSKEMERSKMGEAVIQNARMDYAREQKMKEAEAKAAQQEALDARLSGLEGALASEAGTGMLPDIQPKTPTDAELLIQRLTKAAGLYDTIADRLDAAGFSVEAENARARARESIGGLLTVRKQLADIGYTEAKTAAEGKGKWANLAPYVLPDGTEVTGGTFNGQLAVQGPDGKPRAMPPGATKRASVPPQPASAVATKGQMGVAMPFIKEDPMASELSDSEQTALASWMANQVQELLRQKKTTDPNAAYLLALEEAKKQGLLREQGPSEFLGVDVPFTGGPVFTLKPEQVPQGAPNSAPEPTAQADPEGSVRRYVGDRVALFDEKTKKFIRYVD